MKISIVIPVLNEEAILFQALSRLHSELKAVKQLVTLSWEVIISDGGSSDYSVPIAQIFARDAHWIFIESSLADPSIGKTIRAGLALGSGDFILVLPCDCELRGVAFRELSETLETGNVASGAFEKNYIPSSFPLSIYAWLQNRFRLRVFHHSVWTNAIFFSASFGKQIPSLGFLEDIIFSDLLRRSTNWVALRGPVWVSSRRYFPSKNFRRIAISALILLLYRGKLAGPRALKKLYLER